MIYLVKNSNNKNYKDTIALLNKLQTEYQEVDILSEPLPKKLFDSVLSIVGDVYSLVNTTKYRSSFKSEVDLEDFKISQVYEFFKSNPRILKGPILLDDYRNICLLSFNKDKIEDFFKPRKLKRKEYLESLNLALLYEEEIEPYEFV